MSGSPEVKYRGVALLKNEGHSVKKCCELLKVSYSGFYDCLNRKPSKRKEQDDHLKAKILSIFGKSKETYGSPRIQKSLQRDGEKVGKDKVAKLMKEEGLRAKCKRTFRPKTTINNPSTMKSARVFKIEESQVTGPNQVWVSDLTYLPTGKGFSYLVTVMDIFNREIKGWDVSDSMEAGNTKKALLEAVKRASGRLKGLVFHSDQGIQYCSSEVRNKLKILKITQSMSRKGNCYDNAFAESFFGTMKNELDKNKFEDLNEVKREIFKYVNWYNRERLHSSLGYLSPMEYKTENRLAA
ncbi:MAG: IS3 family transposase [Bdellovibrio sp. CG11_big_fil_rev_8_21_14_0_20_39_38]|nr:MAG: IS3 family transposase [Bdellovibrio sp. CG11_big_fil_rev_8_21_14_0_20_39_38]